MHLVPAPFTSGLSNAQRHSITALWATSSILLRLFPWPLWMCTAQAVAVMGQSGVTRVCGYGTAAMEKGAQCLNCMECILALH